MGTKSLNYTTQEFTIIRKSIADIGMDNIAGIEKLADTLGREPISVYNFILRKYDVEMFPNVMIRKQFKEKYYVPGTKKQKDPTTIKPRFREKHIEEDEKPAEKFVRAPAEYSNFDHQAWANNLLKD